MTTTILGLTTQEFWTGVIAFCAVGLIYFGRQTIDADIAADSIKPFKWGDVQRRSVEESIWFSHPILAAFTALIVFFILQAAI